MSKKQRKFCHYCAVRLRDGIYTRDHIVPKALGGLNTAWNLRPACRDCNMRKGHSTFYRSHCDFCEGAWAMHEELGILQQLGEPPTAPSLVYRAS